jgi:hypothetical protein
MEVVVQNVLSRRPVLWHTFLQFPRCIEEYLKTEIKEMYTREHVSSLNTKKKRRNIADKNRKKRKSTSQHIFFAHLSVFKYDSKSSN